MTFPAQLYGRCSVCGGRAADDPDAVDADVKARDTTGSGLVLIMYQGKAMCQLCKKTLESDEQSRICASKHARERQFRSRAGFRNTIT